MFWRWLKAPTWGRALATGCVLGVAELSKSSWIIFFVLLPLLWLLWSWSEFRRKSSDQTRESTVQFRAVPHFSRNSMQLVGILLLGLYFLNLGYGFDGSFTQLKKFEFVSHALGGQKPGIPGNRFREAWLGEIPMTVPKQYLRGIDLQKKDFEDYGQPSYLRWEWKDGGWWYYYLYGLAVKPPHGSQLLVLWTFPRMVGAQKRAYHHL